MSRVKIRSYQRGDEFGISKLLNENTPYLRDLNFWVWINRILPSKHSIISIAEIDDTIVGHYAILPFEGSDGVMGLNVGLGVHAFVHPEFRDKVSIFSISAHAYDQAKKAHLDFLIGFPNKNYRLIQEKIERWKPICLFNALELKIPLIARKSKLHWMEVGKEDKSLFAQIQILIDRQKKDNLLIRFNHDLNFWIKRYFLHPQTPYKFFFLEKNNKLEGVLVLKVFKSENENRIHIVDSILTNEITFETIVLDLQYLELTRDIDKIVLWPKNADNKSALLKTGFTETGFDTFVCLKEINKNMSYSKYLDFKNWSISMGDSDAF